MRKTKRGHDFDTYVVAHQRAYSWAERAVQYRGAGKGAQARAAVEKVNQWMRRIAMLAPQPEHGAVPANILRRNR